MDVEAAVEGAAAMLTASASAEAAKFRAPWSMASKRPGFKLVHGNQESRDPIVGRLTLTRSTSDSEHISVFPFDGIVQHMRINNHA